MIGLISLLFSIITYFALIGSWISHGSPFPDNFGGWIIFIAGAVVAPIVVYWANKKNEEENRQAEWRKQYIIRDTIKGIEGFNQTQEFTSMNGNEKLLIDENSKQICFYWHEKSPKKYSFSDILKSEVIINGDTITSTSRSSQIGGALLGSVLAGGVGAIIGGLSGKQTTKENISEIKLQVIVNDTKSPVQTINFYKSNISHSKDLLKKEIDSANYCHNLISVLIKQADEHDSEMDVKTKDSDLKDFSNKPVFIEETVDNTSLTEELEKLVLLKQEGLLSDEEFSNAKKKIIG